MTIQGHPVGRESTSAGLAERISRWGDRLVLVVARHWLVFLNLAVAIYLILPLSAPVLMHAGLITPGRVIYTLYAPMCHQLPERSFFLFGRQPIYSLRELRADGVLDANDGYVIRRHYLGDTNHGYKVAFCERDTAIYASILMAGILFACLRRRLRPLPLKWFFILLIPMALDGGTQLVGLRESSWWLRVLTGSLFGIASVWLAYPYVESAMRDVVQETAARQVRRAQRTH